MQMAITVAERMASLSRHRTDDGRRRMCLVLSASKRFSAAATRAGATRSDRGARLNAKFTNPRESWYEMTNVLASERQEWPVGRTNEAIRRRRSIHTRFLAPSFPTQRTQGPSGKAFSSNRGRCGAGRADVLESF